MEPKTISTICFLLKEVWKETIKSEEFCFAKFKALNGGRIKTKLSEEINQ
jgi:hypothetical protein